MVRAGTGDRWGAGARHRDVVPARVGAGAAGVADVERNTGVRHQVRWSVHWAPSHHRCRPLWPGSGYQPGGTPPAYEGKYCAVRFARLRRTMPTMSRTSPTVAANE